MTILKVIIPKGEMPKSCGWCIKSDGLTHTYTGERFLKCKIKGNLKIGKDDSYYNERNLLCPLEEKNDGD